MGLYLAPASRENLETTIFRPVARSVLAEYLDSHFLEELERRAGVEGIHCWAMTRASQSRFANMAPGDDVVFAETAT
jgi:hypothetical protein